MAHDKMALTMFPHHAFTQPLFCYYILKEFKKCQERLDSNDMLVLPSFTTGNLSIIIMSTTESEDSATEVLSTQLKQFCSTNSSIY